MPLTETFTYDTLGRLTSSTNAKGEQSNYAYSKIAAGEVVTNTQTLENGKVAKTEITYGPEAKFAYPTVIREYYTDQNNQTTPTQTTISYHLLLGLVKSETDNSGNVTTYQYDKLGRVTSMKQPNFTETGSTTTYSVEDLYDYSLSGILTNKFDSNSLYLVTEGVGSKAQYKNSSTGETNVFNERNSTYDGFGNLRSQELWDFKRGQWLEEASYHYDALARPLNFIDAEGNRSTYEYDAWGNLYKTIDPLGNTYRSDTEIFPRKQTTYLVESRTGNKKNVLEETLDQWGRIVEKKAYPAWPNTTPIVSETFTYDVVGNVLSYKNPNGNTTTYTYDKMNQLTQVQDPLNQVTGYAYTTLGGLKSITFSDGTKTWVSSKEYDELGQLRKNITPTSQMEQFVPNALGQVVQRTDPKGQVFSYSYDSHYRQTGKNGATSSFAYTYYSPFGESWIEQFSNSNLVRLLGMGYNAQGQVDYSILYNEIYQHETTYSYDKVGNLTSIRNPFSFGTLYGYNKNRVNRVQTDGSTTANTADEVNARYDYYPNGSVKSITYPKLKDGTYLKATYEYDDLGQLKKVTNTKGTEVLSEYSYSHDANGNITGVTDASGATTYLYDKLDRLIEVQRPNGSLSKYTYDVRGNRSTVKDDTWSINLEDTDYTFNERDQLTEILTGTGYGGYQYGPLDLRTKKKTLTEEVRYHYNLNDQVIAESNASNAIIANYIWGPDRALAMKDASGNEYYYLYNGHGDVIQMVDANGTVVNQYHYDEWGNILSKEEQVRNPFKYAGEIYDEESGLYYLRGRYYDPAVGRFINKDTYEGDITNQLTLNLYTYVLNNPLMYVDPTGHWCTSIDGKWSRPGTCSSIDIKFSLDATHNSYLL